MKNILFAFTVLVPMALAAPAWADVPPPNAEGCDMKSAGDACKTDDDKDGTCVEDTCSKLDYSDGSPPGTITYACVLCNGPASSSSSSSSGGAAAEGGTCSFGRGASSGAACALALAAGALFLTRRRRSQVG